MIFIQWGHGRRTFDWLEETYLIMTYEYFSIFWCPISWVTGWYVVGDNRSEDRMINQEELDILGKDIPKLTLWQRFGLLMVIGGIVLWVAVASLFS